MNIDEIINNSVVCCEAFDNDKFFFKSLLYPFTTENISGYIDEFNLKNKSLLTVGSSGDQVINAILRDCKNITLYDKVPEAKYYYYLKCAGLLNFSKEQFLGFFRYRYYNHSINDNSNAFNKDLYERLKSTLRLLSYESYLYFDELFNTFSGSTIRQALFVYDEDSTDILERSNLYLKNELLYDETRKKIKNVEPEFVCKDIFDIDDAHKYDNIWLSNIGTWLKTEKEILDLINKTYACLNYDGKLLVSYLYKTNANTSYNSNFAPIYNLKVIKKLLKSYKLELREFDGIDIKCWNKDERKDSALIIKK